ncbi:hypothetical protein M3Y94_00570900 [Aphelenchoides besseyi]|nr:hypothetical protein M3Y94_00570900 [Aphelenchoides besseyi]KAI6218097.1 hypothetical protein M3Y95_01184000 [Aphelenchoides besseyi]
MSSNDVGSLPSMESCPDGFTKDMSSTKQLVGMKNSLSMDTNIQRQLSQRQGRSPRRRGTAVSASIKTSSRFWFRVLRPWKWRRPQKHGRGTAADDRQTATESEDQNDGMSRSSSEPQQNAEGSVKRPICRRDTLALRIDRVEAPDAPEPIDDIPNQTADDRRKLMHRVSLKLERKLSERPKAQELEERGILKNEEAETISRQNMEETRKILLRKLSFRPTVQHLKDKQIIKFNDYVEVTEADEYCRKGDKPWTRLTPAEKALIRKELNDFKSNEMEVHEESKIFTRFHRP